MIMMMMMRIFFYDGGYDTYFELYKFIYNIYIYM